MWLYPAGSLPGKRVVMWWPDRFPGKVATVNSTLVAIQNRELRTTPAIHQDALIMLFPRSRDGTNRDKMGQL